MPVNELFVILLLIAASAFFSMSEISLAASRKIKLRLLADAGQESARLVLALQEKPGHFFTAIQIGLNAIAILGGIVGEQTLSPFVVAALRPLYVGPYLETIGFAIAFIFVTSLFVLFADLLPRRLAMVRPEPVAMAIVRPMRFFIWLTSPLVWLFDGLANRLLRWLQLPTSRAEDFSAAEIVAMANAGAQAGVLLRQEQQMISKVFELDTRIVPSAMTARDSIVFLTLSESEESIRAKIATTPHGKFPLCRDTIDSVVGYVAWRDILARLMDGKPLSMRIEPMARTVLVLPDSLTLFEALERFRDAKEDFALIVNEYALIVGLLTLQDVMSTVMGELASPFLEEMIVRRDDQSWLIDGATPIEDVMAALLIPEFEGFENYETIAGFLMYSLRKVPRRTDAVIYAGYKFEVVDLDNFRIDQVLVTRDSPPSP